MYRSMGFALILPLLLYVQINSVHTVLIPPENLTLETLNTQYTLRWDWDQSTARNHSVTFNAEFLAKYKLSKKKENWTQACVRTPQAVCDFTGSELHYMGIYMLRVQANAGKLHSPWVGKEFCPDKEAALGPPSSVNLSPANSLLDVAISDPLTNTGGSMKEQVPLMYYRIQYWRGSPDPQGLPFQVDSTANLVTLPDLEPWTWYCVSVQSRFDYYNKTSSFTKPYCMQTQGPTPMGQIAFYFLVSLAGCFLLVLVCSYGSYRAYGLLKSSFYPSIRLPEHFQECLRDWSPASDLPQLLEPPRESDLSFDKVSVCSNVALLEIHTPPPEAPEPEEDSGGHSRQNSRDSGVYSTEGSSEQTLPGSGRDALRGPGSWKKAPVSAPEQMKMGTTRPGPDYGGPVDEGVVDMCV